jgi:hypothetical protein
VKRGSRALAAALLTVLSVAAVAPIGLADSYDAAMARAVAAKEKAVDSNDPAAWEEALRLFIEADAVKSTKDSKYELASAAARLKDDDIAVEAYEAAIALGIAGKAKEKAQAFIKAHASSMGRIDVKGPPGAEVSIGARNRGALPHAPFVAFAGNVKLRAIHGGQTVERTVLVREGVTEPVDLDAAFAPKPAASSAPATSASTPVEPPPKGASATVPLSDTGAAARTLGWSLIVGGGIVVIAGTAGLIVSSQGVSDGRAKLAEHCISVRTDDPDQCFAVQPGERTEAQQANNNIRTWKNVRTAALVTGGVGIMIMSVGIIRLLTAPTPPRASAWVPRVDVGFGYVGLSGQF